MVRLWWVPFILSQLSCSTKDTQPTCKCGLPISTDSDVGIIRYMDHFKQYNIAKKRSGIWNRIKHAFVPLLHCVKNQYTGHWYLVLQNEDVKQIRFM